MRHRSQVSNASKRAMARDQIDVMRQLGFDTFAVVGHDRGARCAYRMALDHPGKAIDCGHFLPEEAPDETFEALREFLVA